jgi:hypothetical protein
LQVGVVAVIIPDPNNPQFSVYWLRDACLVYYVWLNELTVLGDKNLRPMADDMTHALVRTQQVVSIAGNVLSGGIGEAVFDIKINPIQSEDSRIGSPAAGEWFRFMNGYFFRLEIDVDRSDLKMGLPPAPMSWSNTLSG